MGQIRHTCAMLRSVLASYGSSFSASKYLSNASGYSLRLKCALPRRRAVSAPSCFFFTDLLRSSKSVMNCEQNSALFFSNSCEEEGLG